MTDELDIRDLYQEDEVDERLDAEKAMEQLSARDRRVIYLRFSDYTQAEIGERVGLSQRHIGRILDKMSKKGV